MTVSKSAATPLCATNPTTARRKLHSFPFFVADTFNEPACNPVLAVIGTPGRKGSDECLEHAGNLLHLVCALAERVAAEDEGAGNDTAWAVSYLANLAKGFYDAAIKADSETAA